jgi:cardiolipin synthase
MHPTHSHDCLPTLATGREADAILFTEGDELYAAMIDSIENAQHEIALESYLFADDEVGRRFADVLIKKVAAGVRVRLLLDAEGCRSRMSRKLARHLADSGVEVRRFRPWRWGSPGKYWQRDHRKLLVVDGTTAFLGGFNIHRESSREFYGEKRWRDTHVRLGGSLAGQAGDSFNAFWQRDLHWEPQKSDSSGSMLMPNQTRACMHQLRCIYGTLFAEARSSIRISTPYFVPDHRTQNGLIEAAQRGVEVSLLVPAKSDVPITRWAARAAYARLLASGVKIYEYLPRMFHAKTAVIDGTWATIGTANMDYRSLFLNYELNLITRDEQLCRQLEIHFSQDLSESAEIRPHAWTERKWTEYFYETIGWLGRRWL